MRIDQRKHARRLKITQFQGEVWRLAEEHDMTMEQLHTALAALLGHSMQRHLESDEDDLDNASLPAYSGYGGQPAPDESRRQ